jgi:hypothetical protein
VGLIFKAILLACAGWGALYAVQQHWMAALTSQIAAQPQPAMFVSGPVMPTMTSNAAQLTKGLNSTIGPIDTSAAQRAAANHLGHQIYLQNRAAAAAVPLPPQRIPGLPR